jgi:hypothetical protein
MKKTERIKYPGPATLNYIIEKSPFWLNYFLKKSINGPRGPCKVPIALYGSLKNFLKTFLGDTITRNESNPTCKDGKHLDMRLGPRKTSSS